MDLLGYMLSMVRTGPISLTYEEQRVLSLVAHSEITSTYMIWKTINNSNKIAYKNVHKKVAKLLNLELIRIVKKSEKHGAIFYRLTSLGLFCSILSHYYPEFSKLIDNYSKDEMLNIFLYPYFEKNTLRSLNSGTITGIILGYLRDCLNSISSDVYDVLMNSRQEMNTMFLWSSVPSNDRTQNKYFLQFLRERFEINWLNDNASLEKSSDGKELRIISDNNKYLVIKLDENITKATLMDSKVVIFEFAVLGGDHICEYQDDWFNDEMSVRQFGSSVSKTVQAHAQKLAFTLLSLEYEDTDTETIYPYQRAFLKEPLMKKRIEKLKQQMNLIKKDKKFVALCKDFYKQFERYKIF